jgi:hypothetical protein
MLLATVLMIRHTSVRVKDKACIYNDLRLIVGIGRIAGIGQRGQADRTSGVTHVTDMTCSSAQH